MWNFDFLRKAFVPILTAARGMSPKYSRFDDSIVGVLQNIKTRERYVTEGKFLAVKLANRATEAASLFGKCWTV